MVIENNFAKLNVFQHNLIKKKKQLIENNKYEFKINIRG